MKREKGSGHIDVSWWGRNRWPLPSTDDPMIYILLAAAAARGDRESALRMAAMHIKAGRLVQALASLRLVLVKGRTMTVKNQALFLIAGDYKGKGRKAKYSVLDVEREIRSYDKEMAARQRVVEAVMREPGLQGRFMEALFRSADQVRRVSQ
jgi:hypothetical protein